MSLVIKRIAHIVLLVSVCSVLLVSCEQWKDFEIKSVSVRTISPRGLKAADLTMGATVNNPGKAIQIDSIFGVIKVADKPMVRLDAADILLESGQEKDYEFPVNGAILEGINVFYILGALTDSDASAVRIDVLVYAKLAGTNFGKTIEYKDIPLISLIGR